MNFIGMRCSISFSVAAGWCQRCFNLIRNLAHATGPADFAALADDETDRLSDRDRGADLRFGRDLVSPDSVFKHLTVFRDVDVVDQDRSPGRGPSCRVTNNQLSCFVIPSAFVIRA